MSFDNSPFAKSLFLSGTPRKSTNPATTQSQFNTPIKTTSPITSASPRTPVAKPSTPSSTPNAFKPSTPTSMPTGTWKHPALDVVRRRTVNKEIVLKKSLINSVLLALAYIASRRFKVESEWGVYLTYLCYFLEALTGYNLLTGVYQLMKPQEKFDDLPITPSQRKLLGLPASPNAAKDSPSPPRYLKSSPQTRVSPRPSPLSRTTKTNGSPLSKFSPSSSPSKFSAASPTASKFVNSNGSPSQRSPSPIKSMQIGKALNTSPSPASPTPAVPAAGSSTPFTPTGRYMYMSDSVNSRRSVLRKY